MKYHLEGGLKCWMELLTVVHEIHLLILIVI